jgi:hypothetical protein
MATLTEWLRTQLRQERLNCRTLARRSGLTATKIRLAVAQDVAPSALAVRRLAKYFGVDEAATLRMAAEQVAATTIAETPLEREFVCALYLLSCARFRRFSRDLAAGVYESQDQALVAARGQSALLTASSRRVLPAAGQPDPLLI